MMMLLARRGLSQQQLLRQQRVSLQEKFSSPSLLPKIRINGSQRLFFVLQVSSSCLRNNRANNFKMIRASLLSTKSKGETEEQSSSSSQGMKKFDYDEYDDYDDKEPLTMKEKMQAYGRLLFTVFLLGVGGSGIFYLATELFPGRTNPNGLFSEVFDLLRTNNRVMRVVGEDAKAFGRDVGAHTEGRRNNIESYRYHAIDGSKRLRIRFNIKGSRGQVVVWAEAADTMGKNEYVYVICQNMRNGRVMTIDESRESLEDEEVENPDTSSTWSSYFYSFLPKF